MIRHLSLSRWMAPFVLIVALGCSSAETTDSAPATETSPPPAASEDAPVDSQTCFDAGCECVEWTVGSGAVCGTCAHSHDLSPSVDEGE